MTDPHRIQELRSIEMHRLVAEALDDAVLARTRERLEAWLAAGGPMHPEYARRWLELLDRPTEELAELLVEDSEEMRAMRQSSPFAGVLSDEARLAVLRGIPLDELREDERCRGELA